MSGRWTRTEDAALRARVRARVSNLAIARELGRTLPAVKKRIVKLRLTRRTGRRAATIRTDVDRDLRDRAREAARERGVTVSTLVREALEREVSR